MEWVLNFLSGIALFGLLIVTCVFIAFAEYVAGWFAYSFGFYSFGLRLMAISGFFPKSLPKLCAKANMCCDGSCKLWTCPRYSKTKE